MARVKIPETWVYFRKNTLVGKGLSGALKILKNPA